MNFSEYIQIGYVARAHGLKGEVEGVFDVHDLEEYREKKRLFLSREGQAPQAYKLKRFVSHKKNHVRLKFEGINDRNAAEALKGSTLYIPEADLPQLEPGQFYYFETIGYQVVDTVLGPLGVVQDYYDGAAHDTLAMLYQKKEVLIPMVEAVVLRADKEAQQIWVNLPEGLLDLYLE